MFSDLVLLHRPGGTGHADLSALLRDHEIAAFMWQTCLRQIAVIEESQLENVRASLSEGDEIHNGEEAYGFLLQVICGLHSPMIGETEVYGQFKNAVAAHESQLSPLDLALKRFFKALFEDAKRIRQGHLEDLGSQTYGSVLRREVKGLKKLHILGAGQFVQDILPWISKDGNEIHVYARNPDKARLALPKAVHVHSMDEAAKLTDAEALIIAAPLSAEWIATWVAARIPVTQQFELIADLRADSATDRVSSRAAVRTLDLSQVFERISANQTFLQERKSQALTAVEASVRARSYHVEYRPFGWEDVCA